MNEVNNKKDSLWTKILRFFGNKKVKKSDAEKEELNNKFNEIKDNENALDDDTMLERQENLKTALNKRLGKKAKFEYVTDEELQKLNDEKLDTLICRDGIQKAKLRNIRQSGYKIQDNKYVRDMVTELYGSKYARKIALECGNFYMYNNSDYNRLRIDIERDIKEHQGQMEQMEGFFDKNGQIKNGQIHEALGVLEDLNGLQNDTDVKIDSEHKSLRTRADEHKQNELEGMGKGTEEEFDQLQRQLQEQEQIQNAGDDLDNHLPNNQVQLP